MSGPPRWGERLLEWLLAPDAAEEVTGDLREEWRRRGGGLAARFGHLRAVASVVGHFALRGRARVGWLRELRLAGRRLRRDPTFTVVGVVAIALGIGVNVLMLAVANAVLFAPLPYPAEDRLAVLTNDHTGSSTGGFGVAYDNIRDVRERSATIESVALYLDWQDVAYQSADGAIRLPAAFVSQDYARVLGLETAIGRFIGPDENRENAPGAVAVLGRATWNAAFGADPGVVGRTLVLNGRPFEVVGVVDDDRGDLRYLWGQDPVGIYLPLFAAEELVGFDLDADRGGRFLNGLVRVHQGWTVDQARSELEAVSRELERTYPRSNEGWTYHLEELDEALFEQLRAPTSAVLGISLLVFLLVAVNLVTLVVLRSAGRAPEMAVRTALGAGRRRLLAQVLTESSLLAAGGWCLGVLLAWWLLAAFSSSGAVRLPEFTALALDVGTVGVSVVAAAALALLLGVVPWVMHFRSGVSPLGSGTRGTASRRRMRLQSGLVAAEVAVAFVLLVGAGLLVESFRTLHGTGYGFDTERLLTLQIDTRTEELGDDGLRAYVQALAGAASGLAGVESAFTWSPNRLGHGNRVDIVTPEGRWATHPEERIEAAQHTLHPGTLARLGLRVLSGRDVTAADDSESPRVALVSESLAGTLWPGRDPVGQRFETVERGEQRTVEVVGVVSDARHRTRLVEPFGPQRDVYYPYAQSPSGLITLAVRYTPDARVESLVDLVRAIVRELSPAAPVYGVATMDERMRDEEATARSGAVLVAAYAALAVALAALGLYGVLAHGVRMRREEIGIRMALGADGGRVLRRVVGQGMAMAGVGLVVGILAAIPGGRLLGAALYGVEASAPRVLSAVSVGLAAVALASSWIPARRSTRVAPADVLRAE